MNAFPLADVMLDDRTREPCAWPDCQNPRDAHGFCRKHNLRLKRGWPPGAHDSWDRLVAAALAIWNAETDEEFDRVAEELDRAAIAHGRSPSARHPSVRGRRRASRRAT